jgi:hypothetical protein
MARTRPNPPWHPVPVSEIAMLAGAVALVVGLFRGPDPAALAVGIAAMALGVVELSLREHRAGYRQHTLLLAGATAATVHLGFVLLAPFRYVGPLALLLDLLVFAAGHAAFDAMFKRSIHRHPGP